MSTDPNELNTVAVFLQMHAQAYPPVATRLLAVALGRAIGELPAGQRQAVLDKERRAIAATVDAYGVHMLPEPYPADSVPMPVSADQAAGMVNLGMMYLRQHAPDRLSKGAGAPFTYHRTFRAIAAAAKVQGDAVSISVATFVAVFNEPHQPGAECRHCGLTHGPCNGGCGAPVAKAVPEPAVGAEAVREALRPFAELPMPERDGFTLYTRAEVQAARDALASPPAAPAAGVPDGWKVVPIEPTEAMIERGWYESDTHGKGAAADCYRGCIAAAPSPPVPPAEGA